jgi:hypothetical protein
MECTPDEDGPHQLFVAVHFGDDDDEPVLMPVSDPGLMEDEEEKARIIDDAWSFYQHGQFVREADNSKFISALAEDLAKQLPLQEMLCRVLVGRIGEVYIARFEKAVHEQGTAIVDKHALHLTVEGEGTEQVTIILVPPTGWEEKAIARCRNITDGLFTENSTGPLSWAGFTEWLWVNQLTRALDQLAADVGEEALEAMPEHAFQAQLIRSAFENEDSGREIGELILSFLHQLADIAVEGIASPAHELWMLELLLGFRDEPPEGAAPGHGRRESRIVQVDFGSLLRAIARQPDDLYRLPPRRFEELVAHIFERFGYEVALTPKSRDGGFDIAAIRREETEVRLLIECKRYTPPNKVGRPVVQQVLGVLTDRRATKAIIATTSTFTGDARAFFEANKWQLEGRDRDGILKWIQLLEANHSPLLLP